MVTEEVRTRAVPRTHCIRQITLCELILRLQTHVKGFVDRLAVAEADMSSQQHIRVDRVILRIDRNGDCYRTAVYQLASDVIFGWISGSLSEKETKWRPGLA